MALSSDLIGDFWAGIRFLRSAVGCVRLPCSEILPSGNDIPFSFDEFRVLTITLAPCNISYCDIDSHRMGARMHIAVIGLGEAGALYTQGLVALGWDVTGYDPADVPTPLGAVRAETSAALVETADAVLCMVGGRAAVPAAQSVAEFLPENSIFIDMNSAAAAVKNEVAESVGAHRYADVAVVGSVPEHGAGTPLVISGQASAPAAKIFSQLGAPVEDISGEPGDAAKRKLLRSTFMKGLGALIVETLRAGEAMGARDWALNQISAEHSGGFEAVERLFSGTVKHADRRGHEAAEAAEMIDSLSVQSTMSHAAARSHRLIAASSKMPADEILAAYANVPAANIGDARERMGLVDGGIKALWPGARAVGRAKTVIVPAGDNLLLRQALEEVEPGEILMVNGQGHADRALLGELMAERARKRGAVGIVADGALRDVRDLEEMGFPAWARAVNPAGPYKNGPGQIDVPVAIGRVVVEPGDLVVADDDGVVVVPWGEVVETLGLALAVQEDEAGRRQKIIGGDLT
ncbi:RraA family protein [Brevibacterium sp. CSND-B09]|uniref:RraA family protein n=1 Tax=Brevibacterium sp. CSND-B09 TaxID=3462571 RepID=UPI00406A5AAB